jgi:general secretion pathway protein G
MKNNKNKRINEAFSLMEVLIWCAIAGIFGSLVIVAGSSYIEKQKVKATIQDMSIYSAALLDFYSDVGRYPTNEEGLKVLVEKNYIKKGNNGENDKESKLLDQWKNEYIYTPSDDNTGYILKSLGSDKKEGGEGTKKDLIVDESEKNGTSDENSLEQ